VVWCRDCGRQVEPNPGEMAERYPDEADLCSPADLRLYLASDAGEKKLGRSSLINA
jgi:hypothetical protein